LVGLPVERVGTRIELVRLRVDHGIVRLVAELSVHLAVDLGLVELRPAADAAATGISSATATDASTAAAGVSSATTAAGTTVVAAADVFLLMIRFLDFMLVVGFGGQPQGLSEARVRV